MSISSQLHSEDTEVAAAVSSGPLTAHDGGRRDRKKQATREALRSAAVELVAQRGFAHVTIEDITEAADVATRTFFNYFPSKESAVIGAEPEETARIRQSLLARPLDESPLDTLRAVAMEYTSAVDERFDNLGEDREVWLRRFCTVRNDPDLKGAYVAHTTEIERILVTALAERLGKDAALDPYPAIVAGAVMAAIRAAALFWSANGGVGSLARLTGTAIDCLAGGLVDEKAFIETKHQESRKNQDPELLNSDGTDKVDNYS